jgi:hypothetical protein
LIRNVTKPVPVGFPLQAVFECFSDPLTGEKDGLVARGRDTMTQY